MNRRQMLGILGAGSAAVAWGGLNTGCGGPQWQIVSQSTPNRLVGVKSYLFTPVTWNGFTWDGVPESQWLATRTPEQQAGWATDRAAVTERIFTRLGVEKHSDESIAMLSGPPAQGQFVLAVNVDSHSEKTFRPTLKVSDAAGQVVDEIRLPFRQGASGFLQGVAIQLNTFVVWTASDSLAYLRTRYRSARGFERASDRSRA